MRRSRLAVLGVTAALLGAGCGGGDEEQAPAGTGGDSGPTETAANGKEAFARTCGGCHTLADAGTNGQVGPNLDDVKPDAAQVKSAIADGPGAMPQNLVTGPDADAVAEYVAGAAGK